MADPPEVGLRGQELTITSRKKEDLITAVKEKLDREILYTLDRSFAKGRARIAKCFRKT